MHRLSFLPSNAHSSAVYNFRAYTEEEIQKMKKLLREKVRAGEIDQQESEQIHAILDDIYATKNVLSAQTFSDQVTITNFHLWKKLFEKMRTPRPNLLYIEQESLVTQLIIDHHLQQDTTIYHILFDPKVEPYLYQYFEGITGTFSRTERWGTYLFWGVSPDKNYRIQLWKRGQFLISDDGSVRFHLTPEGIKAALESKQIVPSMMLIFTVLCLYYGLKCLGGFSQVNYLTSMKNAYIKMQVDRGMYRSIEVCARAQTKELVGDVTAAFLGTPSGELVPATGLDLILYGDENMWNNFVDETKNITLREAMDVMMPEFYRIMYPEPERDPLLSSITAEDIMRDTHLGEKTRACVTLPQIA